MIEQDEGVASQPGDHTVGAAAAATAVAATVATEPADQPTAEAPPAGPADDAAATAAGPTVRKIEGPAAEPIELSGLAGGAVLKRALPLVGGLAILLLVVRWLRRR